MFESFWGEAAGVLGLTIGGISLGAILLLTTYVIRQIRCNRREISLNKDQVTIAFKEAILPKNIKLDVSGKIQKPIKEGMDEMKKVLEERIETLEEGQKLTLQVLSQFTHVTKLPQEVQDKIAEYCDEPGTTEVL